MPANSDLLQAALIGYEAELSKIKQAIAEIRHQLKPADGNVLAAPTRKKRARRKMSAAGRARIITALKKRWAKYHRQKSAKA